MYQPGNHAPISYGAKVQQSIDPEEFPCLDDKGVHRLQKVIGCLLFYALAIDSTMLVALGDLASAQSTSTEHTAKALTKLLNYAAINPDTEITYHKSDMILHIDSDALYLLVSKCRSQAGGSYYLSDKIGTPSFLEKNSPPINSPIYVLSKIMRNVVASAAESELGALLLNGQKAVPICTTLL